MRGFDAAACFGAYEGTLRELIHLYKYSKIRTMARPLSNLLMAALPRTEAFDAVTPVPLHWRKRWQRSFNQSELLAREIARRTGIPVLNAVRRVRATQTQAGLSNTGRRQNVTKAFECRSGERWRQLISGKRILLIDDVMTTGSTAASCALALKQGGASRVVLLTVARVDRRMSVAPAATISTAGSAS
jgi:ComF family protein